MTPANPQLSTAARPRVGIPWRTSHEEANQITNKLQYYFAAVTEAAGEPIPISLQLSPQQLAAHLPPKSRTWTPSFFLEALRT